MLEPDLAENMLDDAYGNPEKYAMLNAVSKEAKRRTKQITYWTSIIDNAEQTAQSGYYLDSAIALMSKALSILKAATLKNV